jgi:cytochrome c
LNAARATLALAAFLIGALAHAEDQVPPDARVYLTQYKCYFCHADREAKAGPALADVARRHRNDRDAVARIAAEIRRGIRGGGPWHMPPHPEVSVREARAIARYVMSLAPPKGGE